MHDLAQLITNWDRATFLAINHGLKCGFLDRIILPITDLGLGQVQALIVLGVAIALTIRAGEVRWKTAFADIRAGVRARRDWIGPLLVSFVVSGITSDVIKLYSPRLRPWWFYEKEHLAGHFLNITVETVTGIEPLKVHGFPSGHTATTFALAVVLTILFHSQLKARPLIFAGWCVALSVAMSRMYLGSHWPLDVLGGALIGAASGWLAVAYCRSYARRHADKRASNPVVRTDAALPNTEPS